MAEHTTKAVARTLREHRKSLGISQHRMVALCNSTPPLNLRTTRSSLSKYEVGLAQPTAALYLKLLGLR